MAHCVCTLHWKQLSAKLTATKLPPLQLPCMEWPPIKWSRQKYGQQVNTQYHEVVVCLNVLLFIE